MHECGSLWMSLETIGSSRVADDALQRAGPGGLGEGGVDLGDGGLGLARMALKSVIEPVGTGTRSDVPSSLPFIDSSTSDVARAAPVLVGHDVDRRAAGPAEVLVRAVDEHLVAGVGVDRRHQALLDAERVVEHLDHRHEAVRRAAGVGDDLVLLGVEVGVVDAHHERAVGAGGRGRDDDERGAGVEVGGGLVAGGEEAGRLDDEVDAEVAPRQLGRVADREHLQLVVADLDAVLGRLDRRAAGCRASSRT